MCKIYIFNMCSRIDDCCGTLITLGENILKHTIKHTIYFFKYYNIKHEQKKVLLLIRSKNTGIWGVHFGNNVLNYDGKSPNLKEKKDFTEQVSRRVKEARPWVVHESKCLGNRRLDPALVFIK